MYFVASDHGAIELRGAIVSFLQARGIEVLPLGPAEGESADYPDFGEKVARAVSSGEAEKGILLCGTGIGMSIVANKFPGVRAALITDDFTAQMSKEHNNANIIVMGGRVLTETEACAMVKTWLDTEFEGGRHQRRLDKISAIEEALKSGEL